MRRKRFYVVVANHGGASIVNLRWVMTSADISYTHRNITGPFRTYDAAVTYVERLAEVKEVVR